uniref:Uncharacterized protein n=1 Tax=Arundo donax TaxID=35708 RepID=A0A0A9GQC6_ARUDO
MCFCTALSTRWYTAAAAAIDPSPSTEAATGDGSARRPNLVRVRTGTLLEPSDQASAATIE